ncbi:TRZ/ATZ family hydrolase [Simiduia agarivorans]|uniref:N-ethylammeline chlorohydrolase n=1 Tax=Simiduia agarivorans (strain DSM 21679 / JCM 13881 / BCRC 17597 / SA1) TaxID=1117647 RepID=K4KFL5_SIMAS|nr:TRZ/ATZ family hydrolase [Simiduia agarivorans]AFU97721.1 N-ethylammeline chlorohydrolase [Simiduia agarivorans SA1 = DSM 21679]
MNSGKQTVDLVINAKWIAPAAPEGRVLSDCALVISDGKIVDITSQTQATRQYLAETEHHLDHHLVTPGFINAHGHAAMTLLRGYADDLSLQTWLEQHIWPAEGRHVGFDFVYDGTLLATAEMIRSGTSCFSDMYFYPDAAAKAVREAGLRAQITFPIIDFPTPWAATEDEYFSKGLKLHDDYRNYDRIAIAFGPHAPYTVNDQALSRVATLASELDAGIQIHAHETATEIANAGDIRPLERLAQLGVLGPRTQLVHMTQLTDRDIELVQQWQCHVVHCPESNMKLASGICPVTKLIENGVNVALGTDGCASNNDLNMAGEMKSAAFLAKIASGNPASLSAHECLSMATINGAKALGIDNETGSIEKGKRADIAAFPLTGIGNLPCYDPVAQLVYNDNAHSASHLWVDGNALLIDHALTTLDVDQLAQRAQQWQKKIVTGRQP